MFNLWTGYLKVSNKQRYQLIKFMKNKNKLTLNSIQEQIDLIKAQKIKNQNNSTDLKTNADKQHQEITLHMRSSMIYSQIFAVILWILNKFPFINRITNRLRRHYGQSFIWTLLIYGRKIFITFNAIIGLITVIKLAGIGPDTYYANFVMMGSTYIDIFNRFIKNIFNWIFDFFDYKIVPNVPNNPGNWFGGSKASTWYTNPMHNNNFWDIANKGKDWYPSPFNLQNNDSYFKDWSSWMWIIGGVVLITGIVTFGYLGYNYYNTQYNPSTPSAPFPKDLQPRGGASNYIWGLLSAFSGEIIKGIKKLNPLNYLSFDGDSSKRKGEKAVLADLQRNLNTQDTRYYPFTPNNPHDSWWTSTRIG